VLLCDTYPILLLVCGFCHSKELRSEREPRICLKEKT
jgi:hypothetical protein